MCASEFLTVLTVCSLLVGKAVTSSPAFFIFFQNPAVVAGNITESVLDASIDDLGMSEPKGGSGDLGMCIEASPVQVCMTRLPGGCIRALQWRTSAILPCSLWTARGCPTCSFLEGDPGDLTGKSL